MMHYNRPTLSPEDTIKVISVIRESMSRESIKILNRIIGPDYTDTDHSLEEDLYGEDCVAMSIEYAKRSKQDKSADELSKLYDIMQEHDAAYVRFIFYSIPSV